MRPENRTTRAAWGVLPVAVALAALGCNGPAAPPAQSPPPSPAAAVSVVSPKRQSLRRVVEQPGAVQAYEQTVLFAKFPGFVRTVRADIGQAVRGPKLDSSGKETEPGEVLAELAIPEMDEEANQKRALVRQAEAEVEQARKGLASADARVESADAAVVEARAGIARSQALFDRWESESKRITGLVKGGVVDSQTSDETNNQFRASAASRDESKARVVTAEAEVRRWKADRDKAAADIDAATARLDVAKAEVRRLEALLGYTKIRAPYDGVVTQRLVNTGDFLQATGGKAVGVFTVARLDPVRVVVEVPESAAGLVREKAEVLLTVQALGGPELKGTVTRTSWALDPGSRVLRTEIDLPNSGPNNRLRPGMYVYAKITADLPEAWLLPAAAVGKQGDAAFCYQVRDGKAVKLPVRLGRGNGESVEILKKQRPSPPTEWEEITGTEAVATPAASVTDGQAVAGR